VDHGASVINLSLGGAMRSEEIASALRYAAEHDVVVVACTGNVATDPGARQVWYPAREPGVIAVAGLGAADGASAPSASPSAGAGGAGGGADALWPGSLTGPETVLTAPAVDLTGAKPGGGYWQVQGTSFAAPLVAGVASLVRARYPRMSAANVINRLIGTAKDLGAAGWDDRFGYGEVDPVAALRESVGEVAENPLTQAPTATETAPRTGGGAKADGGARPEDSTPLRHGGAAPIPSTSAAAAGVERLAADDGRAGTSMTAGLAVMLLILIGGAGGVLLHHRRRAQRPPAL
jgi:subtilisin family serine protease